MVLFFAHELTHIYYARLSDEKNVRASTPTDEAKLNLLTKLFEESLGDQYDKAPYLRLSDAEFAAALLDADRREYLREYRQHYGNARALVEELNTALAGNDDQQINALAQRLPLEGRPLGFYMTSLVRARLGDGRLKTLVGDAFAWHAAFLEASRDR